MVILVTHNRYFLDNVVDGVIELDRGEGIPFKGNYSSWLEQTQKCLAQTEKEEGNRQQRPYESLSRPAKHQRQDKQIIRLVSSPMISC